MRKKNPTFSIVTICKNAEDLIENTILSLMKQSFREFEYIIIDSKSSDDTINIALNVLNKYEFINYKIISENDSGISEAMNKGLTYSDGKLIYYLHAGDILYDSNVLKIINNDFLENKWRWGVGSINITSKINGNIYHSYESINYSDIKKTLLKQNKIPHQGVFMTKDLLSEVGGFDESISQAMDYDLWLRIIYIKNIEYKKLNYKICNFLEGGKSSNLFELIIMLSKSRAKLKKLGVNVNIFNGLILYSKIIIFNIYIRLKSLISQFYKI